MKILQLFLLLFSFVSCSFPSTKERKINQINKEADKTCRKNLNLNFFAYQPYFNNHKINKLSIRFYIHEKCKVGQARRLLLIATNVYLQAINRQKNIRELLNSYPFQSSNIDITILFLDQNGAGYNSPFIAKAELENNTIKYFIEPREYEYRLVKKETLKKALSKFPQELNQLRN